MSSDNTKYWALGGASDLYSKVEQYLQWCVTSGKMWLWRQSYGQYYQAQLFGATVKKTGESGEFTSAQINQYRNLILHLKTLALQQRPVWEPKASNSDYESMAQTRLATSLLDYYMREKRVERFIEAALETSLVLDEGFVETGWDVYKGDIVAIDPTTKQPIYDGDLFYNVYSPVDVVRDFTKKSHQNSDWVILRTQQNKWTYIARFPELKDKILAAQPDMQVWNQTALFNLNTAYPWDDYNEDNVTVYRMYHKPTPAVPNGRMVEFLDQDTIIFDTPLPYRTVPVYRISPEDQLETPVGYTVGYDLLPMQQAYQGLTDIILSNQAANGVGNIGVPNGSGVTLESADGLRIINYNPQFGPPIAINLTNTPAEVFNFQGLFATTMETISGVNSVARGNPQENLRSSSGAALALIQAQTVQFANGLMQSYNELLEDLGTATIQILQDYAKTPRIASIAGKSNRPYMKEFTGKDLEKIQRVTVDAGNPMSKTTAGRTALAEALMDRQMIKEPQQYLQVIATGRIDPIFDGETSELMLIKDENEKLADATQVRATMVDDHALHIREHKTVLANTEARGNEAVVSATLTHIQEHLDLARTADPFLSQLLGNSTPPPPPGPLMTGAEQGAPPAGGNIPSQPNMPKPPPGTDPASAEIIEGNQQ